MSDTDSDHDPDGHHYGMVCPFWIDTDAYTDRDRDMFVCGFEFAELLRHIRFDGLSMSKTIHRENESRVRMACGRFGRRYTIEPCEAKFDPDGTWSYLEIKPLAAIDNETA